MDHINSIDHMGFVLVTSAIQFFTAFWPWCSATTRMEIRSLSNWSVGDGLAWVLALVVAFVWFKFAWAETIFPILQYLWFGEVVLVNPSIYRRFDQIITEPSFWAWFLTGFAAVTWYGWSTYCWRMYKSANQNGMSVQDWLNHYWNEDAEQENEGRSE